MSRSLLNMAKRSPASALRIVAGALSRGQHYVAEASGCLVPVE